MGVTERPKNCPPPLISVSPSKNGRRSPNPPGISPPRQPPKVKLKAPKTRRGATAYDISAVRCTRRQDCRLAAAFARQHERRPHRWMRVPDDLHLDLKPRPEDQQGRA